MDQLYDKQIKEADLSFFQIDCEHCMGLCCSSLYFSKIDGFPEDKIAGVSCCNLNIDYTCCVHHNLKHLGLKGCLGYDCFGAGQKVSIYIAENKDYFAEVDKTVALFMKTKHVFQILWYLKLASYLRVAIPYSKQIEALLVQGKKCLSQSYTTMQVFDVDIFKEKSNRILKQITLLLSKSKKQTNKMLIGKDLSYSDLSYHDVSMGCMIGANLSNASVYGMNFLGCDTRDVNVVQTDLSGCLFLTQQQLNTMKGDKTTIIPIYLTVPTSWEV